MSVFSGLFTFLFLLLFFVRPLCAQEEYRPIKNWLVTGIEEQKGGGVPIQKNRGKPITADAVLKKHILPGHASPPEPGQKYPGLSTAWTKVMANKKGRVRDKRLKRGYAYTNIESSRERVVLAKVQSPYFLYLNGQGYSSDLYDRRPAIIPLLLKSGSNHLYLKTIRKQFRFRIKTPENKLIVLGHDTTVPDIRAGRDVHSPGAILAVNASQQTLSDVTVTTGDGQTFRKRTRDLPPLPPASIRKVPFPIELKQPVENPEKKSLTLPLRFQHGMASVEHAVDLRIREPNGTYRTTMTSPVDGSVQYYVVIPPKKPVKKDEKVGLLLTMHGAGVKVGVGEDGGSMGYTPKDDMYIVVATNRRPFGFDWEDWGRENGMNVLDVAMDKFPVDPNRVYLAGHSMGGHGTWHLGTTYPGRFAAISPSAGWVSYFGFDGLSGPTEEYPWEFLRRSYGPTDTASLVRNLKDVGVFVIHGSDDDNVPVAHARNMVDKIKKFHDNYRYHEEKGGGHWWDRDGTEGADCVNMNDLFSFFRKNPRTEVPEQVAFRTWNPGISARRRFVRINLQKKLLARSKVTANVASGNRRINVSTKNVRSVSVDPSLHFSKGKITVSVDGSDRRVKWDGKAWLHFRYEDGSWKQFGQPVPDGWKKPDRYGPFIRSFRKNFVLVYGTGGSEEMKEAARARARFDAQRWWYRGNGRAIVLSDQRFDPEKYSGRNVILYGNADNNRAFSHVIGKSPVDVRSGKLVVGDRAFEGTDLSTFYVRPRKESDEHLVGIVGGTGPYGMRASMLGNIFSSREAFPDLFVWKRKKEGENQSFSVVAAGIFGPDWGLANGEIWRK